MIASVCRRTCFVQEFQILDSREELILRLRGAPTDLEVSCLVCSSELSLERVNEYIYFLFIYYENVPLSA